MYHFFAEGNQTDSEEIMITGDDVNHIRNVLRMKPGEQITVSDGRETQYLCEIREIGADRVTAHILEKKDENRELPVRLYLFQGLPKSDKMEWIIQKSIELGVYRVIPVITRRTVVKLDKKKEDAKIRRWNSIAESAAKQSKRGIIPRVAGVMSLEEAFSCAETFPVKIIPFEHAQGMSGLKQELEQMKPGMDAAIFIGPEGGFEEEEIMLAKEAGIVPVSLGKRILRTETAGLMVLSVAGYLLEVREEETGKQVEKTEKEWKELPWEDKKNT